MRGATADAAGQPRSDQGGAHAPPDLQPRRAKCGMAAALPHQAAGPARPGPADGGNSLSLAGTNPGRTATRVAERAGVLGRQRVINNNDIEAAPGNAGLERGGIAAAAPTRLEIHGPGSIR